MKFSILFFFFFINSCSYSLGYKPAVLLGKYKEVHIKLFKNKTQHTGLESIFTDKLISRINLGNKKLIQNFAPIKLEANIVSATVSPISRGNVQSVVLVTEYRVAVKLKVNLKQRWSEKLLWSKTFYRETSYIPPQVSISKLSSVGSFHNDSALRMAFLDIASDVSGDIYIALIDRF
ncbi:MAG: hypothetical protein HAW60_00515 [Bdellovibrionales bacterium]|nr:hypothetical protein [Bdellovibrionales bacterium]